MHCLGRQRPTALKHGPVELVENYGKATGCAHRADVYDEKDDPRRM